MYSSSVARGSLIGLSDLILFNMELKLEIYVYTDESGVFDKNHETTYVYGGVIYLNSDDRENSGRKYIAAETALRKQFTKYKKGELKASRLDNKHKAGLFRSLNKEIKFYSS